MKKNLRQLTVLFICLCVVFCTLFTNTFFVKGQKTVYDSVIRLHVLANSDSDADQQLKLLVRDEILLVTNKLFYNCTDIKSAKATATKNKALLERAAKKVIAKNGFDYEVSIQTDTEIYPVRQYGSFVFPAGEYFSVRVKIGKAKGKNWWCVLFPPMCSSAYIKSTQKDLELLQSYGFTEKLCGELLCEKPQKTVVKFKLLEIIKERLK